MIEHTVRDIKFLTRQWGAHDIVATEVRAAIDDALVIANAMSLPDFYFVVDDELYLHVVEIVSEKRTFARFSSTIRFTCDVVWSYYHLTGELTNRKDRTGKFSTIGE